MDGRILESSRTGHRRPPAEMPFDFPLRAGKSDDTWLRREIWGIAERNMCYGSRRIKIELRRRGFVINGKRVYRIMREEGIWAVYPLREDGLTGSVSGMSLPPYPNMLSGVDIIRPDQVWVADMTRISLRRETVHLAVILDAFSRRCLGWSLGPVHTDRLILKAFRAALRTRAGRTLAGLIHHSDQSLVCTSANYIRFLERNGIRVSMSRRGYPYDNPVVESFFARVKCEEIYLHEYRTLRDVYKKIGAFIQEVYNTKRIHSALGYRPPLEFEEELATGA